MKKQTNVTFRDLTKEQRSKLMSKIRPKDTKPDLLPNSKEPNLHL